MTSSRNDPFLHHPAAPRPGYAGEERLVHVTRPLNDEPEAQPGESSPSGAPPTSAPPTGADADTPAPGPAQSEADDRAVIGAAGLPVVTPDDRTPLSTLLRKETVAVVIDIDAATPSFWHLLAEADRSHPWSCLPCVLLAPPRRAPATAGADGCVGLTPRGRPLLHVERPLCKKQFRRAVHAALHVRRRQHRVRSVLARLQRAADRVRTERDELSERCAGLETRLAAQNHRLRDLVLTVTTTEQRERTRLARILHDHVQHYIHGAKMWAEAQRDDADAAPPDTLDRVVALLDEALRLTQSFSVELSPPVLRTDGLAAAFEWLSHHMRDAHGLDVTLEVAPGLEVGPRKMRVLVFECARELLFNVVKHADTSTARLSASARPARAPSGSDASEVVVTVRDRGCGFDADQALSEPRADARGLRSICQRVRLVGGTISVDSTPGTGTTISLCLPLDSSSTGREASCRDAPASPNPSESGT